MISAQLGSLGRGWLATCVLALALLAGCGRTPLHVTKDGSIVESDGGPDAGPDGGPDGGPCDTCDDAIACTLEHCDPMLGCVSVPDSALCPPGELCVAGVGCTVVPCNTQEICVDRFVCNGTEQCIGGRCVGGQPVECGGNECFSGTCQESAGGCVTSTRDDDNDGFPPFWCMGSDCDDSNRRVFPGAPERCNNGVDDNCNGVIDCDDVECFAQAPCGGDPEVCDDGFDNDGDGRVDCSDDDCRQHPRCLVGRERECRDNIDNDNDGDADCQDSDCASDPVCDEQPELCADGFDNDADGAIDCSDLDCEGDPACDLRSCPNFNLGRSTGLVAEGETSGNGNDSTPSCVANGHSAPEVTYLWRAPSAGRWVIDTAGSNFDTVIEVRNGGCSGAQLACRDDISGSLQSRVALDLSAGQTIIIVVDGYNSREGHYLLRIDRAPPEQCADGADNDFDDTIDCNDIDCFADPRCGGSFNEVGRCFDFIDNDEDGAADCADADCFGDPNCIFTPEWGHCSDFVDNDRDGQVDCQDFDCVMDPFCFAPPTEVGRCTDLSDNDFDGRVDCQDPDCANDPACFFPRTEVGRCADFVDNDGDGLTDCMDPDCQMDPACFMNTCPDEDLGSAVGTVAQGSTSGRGNDATPWCVTSNAPDVSYRWRAPRAGMWAFDTRGSEFDTVLHVLNGGCTGTQLVCRDDIGGSTRSRVTAQLAAGQTVIIFVDGYATREGNYTLIIERDDPVPETGRCADGVDNDRDGSVDCGDSDCANDIVCAPSNERGLCSDMRDNDRDGTTDCQDSDCLDDPLCVPPFECPDRDLGSRLGAPVFSGNTVGQGNDFFGCIGGGAPDMAFRWRVPASGRYIFDTFDSAYDTTLSILQGDCAGQQLACNDDSNGTLDSTVQLNLTRGTEITIVVDGYGSGSGAFVLNISRLVTNEQGACADRTDNDGDDAIDCADSDCADDLACVQECEEREGGVALCTDGLDNDCDGVSDCADTDCRGLVGGECCDGIDNNGDGITDLLACACESADDCGPISTPIGSVPGTCWQRFGTCAPDCSAFPGDVGNTLCQRLNPSWICQRRTGQCVPAMQP